MKLNLDNPVLHFLSQVYDVLYVTVLFVLFSLPVVTIGASYTALSCTMMHIAADSCSGVWTRPSAITGQGSAATISLTSW